LLVRESACEGGHRSLSREHNLLHYRIRGWSAVQEGLAVKDAVQIRRNLPECLVVVLVAMGAADLVNVLPFRLLQRERGFCAAAANGKASRQSDTN
jgi:hypothetical protein